MERPSGGAAGTGDEEEERGGSARGGIALALAALVALAAAIAAIEPLREAVGDALSGDTGALRADLRELEAGGVALLVGVILAHTFIWYPAEIVDAAAGFVYGFWPALALMMGGWLVQGMLAYAIGRRAARPLLLRLVGARRFARAERLIERGGITLLLGARLVPIVPFSLFSYVAGAAKVPVGRFAWTTTLGYLPLTAVFVYVGSRLDSLSPTDPLIWLATLVVIGLLVLAHRLRHLLDGEQPATEP